MLAYYATSMLCSCLTKLVLVEFPLPLTVSLVQQLVASTVSTAAHHRQTGSWRGLHQWRSITPVAGAIVVAGVSYRVSLVYSPVSSAQAVKTLQPLFTTALSWGLLREKSSSGRLASLALLVVGVATATATEVAFSPVGFGCATLSAFAQGLQMVLTKRLLLFSVMHRSEVFAAAALYTLLLLLPTWLLFDLPVLLSMGPPLVKGAMGMGSLASLLLLTGMCTFANQLLGFSVLCSFSSPVSTAVVSTFKRVFVIIGSVFWFMTPITKLHAFGVATAVVAVTLFQNAAATSKLRATMLPRDAPDIKYGPVRAL